MDLQRYNTFRVRAQAPSIRVIHSVEEANSALHQLGAPPYVLGEGSNILLVDDLDRPVLINRIKGIRVVNEQDNTVDIEIGAGQSWHAFVQWAVEQGWGGVENLALIPGTAGAAPIQNIGAYGREIADVLLRVSGLYFNGRRWEWLQLDRHQCRFGYRTSIFKQELRENFIVCGITLRLTRHHHDLRVSYWSLKKWLEQRDIPNPNVQTIFRAVVDIRRQRLPDPEVLPNAGSFFKNVFVTEEQFQRLKGQYEDLPVFAQGGMYKVPSGWLIEKCGWRGKRLNDVGTYARQALILVNYGTPNGRDIYHLAGRIMRDVYDRFGIVLEPEVQIWPHRYRDNLYREYAIPLPAHRARENQL